MRYKKIMKENMLRTYSVTEIRPIGSKFNILNVSTEYHMMVSDLLESEIVMSMTKFTHHGTTTCFQHCVNVSYYNYKICKYLNLDAKSAARGGLLHDLFLYDWHTYKREKGEKLHGFTHASKALENAEKYFELNDIERDVIEKHMFPLTKAMPKYRETVIITLVDKYCGLLETVIPRIRLMIGIGMLLKRKLSRK